eukprot:672305-Pleurochrysis_carterae.AAC.3
MYFEQKRDLVTYGDYGADLSTYGPVLLYLRSDALLYVFTCRNEATRACAPAFALVRVSRRVYPHLRAQ